MDDCEHKEPIFNTISEDLTVASKLILTHIQNHIAPTATITLPDKEVFLTLKRPGPDGPIIGKDQLVVKLDPIDFNHKFLPNASHLMTLRGIYNIADKRIYLNDGHWCIKNLVHETLHACSIVTKFNDAKSYKEFFEGLTELYAGYLLSKSYQSSFNNCWQSQMKTKCSMNYNRSLKTWAAFCCFIPLKKTASIYFNNNSISLEEQFARFTSELVGLGYKKFESFPNMNDLDIVNEFQQRCSESFGESYNAMIDTSFKIDFTKLK